MNNVVDFDQFIDKYQSIICNQPNRIVHVQNGTIEQFYHSVLQDAVVDITLISTRREIQELEPYDSEDPLFDSFQVLIQMVSTVFVKPAVVVKRDLLKYLKSVPANDLRTVETLKAKNLLN